MMRRDQTLNDDILLEPGVAPELVFSGAFYTQGPAEGTDGRIYFCDVTATFRSGMAAGNIWVFDPATFDCRILRSPSGMASSIKFDAAGRMLVATGADFGSRAIIRTDLHTGRSHLVAALHGGRPFNAPSDLVIDRNQRIYFTDPRYFGHEPIEQPVFGVYRIDTDGTVSLILADVSKPKSIDLSPDQKTLYVVEHDIRMLDRRLPATVPMRDVGDMRILAYDLDDGVPSRQRVFVDYNGEKGADGITVDAKGNIYAAVQSRTRPGLRVYSPSGEPLAEVELPQVPSNCTLVAQSWGSYLYITAGSGLYRIKTRIAPISPTREMQ